MNRIFRIFLIAALLVSLCAFASAETYTSSQTDPIIINKPDEHVTITLDGVTITGNNSPAIDIQAAASVTIILADGSENTLTGSTYYAAIQNDAIPLTITCESAGEGHTCNNSCGLLRAYGGYYGAGIGGGNAGNGSNITISGGTVNATGGDDAAGIGGGNEGSAKNITISGGTVTANGGEYGAGIGGGDYGDAENITISGGSVAANGGPQAAGIGGGYLGACYDVTISGGYVTATGSKHGAGIGGGVLGTCSDVTISGGTVTATGGKHGAGIGGGKEASGFRITISGGTVTATGGDYASGVGGGDMGRTEDIMIAPKGVTGIEAKAGADASSATALEGSPFTSGSTDITDLVADQAFFQTSAMIPETGDGANFVLWTSMLLLGAAALVLTKKRAHA